MSHQILANPQSVVLETNTLRPTPYFQDSDSLFIGYQFAREIRDQLPEEIAAFAIEIASYDLTEPASDPEIESELPTEHEFSKEQVASVVASLIEKQKNGEDGPLLTNGRANLFYVKGTDFVVYVYWFGSYWGVDTWNRGVGGWDGGSRVFAPVTGI